MNHVICNTEEPFMTLTRWAAPILAGLMLVGCQQKPAEPLTPIYPAPVAPTAETRQRIAQFAADAQIGQVTAVLPQERMAAVTGLPLKDFQKGDLLIFVGGDQTPIPHAVILNIVADALHVRYQQPAPGDRPPAVGDLAIRFKP